MSGVGVHREHRRAAFGDGKGHVGDDGTPCRARRGRDEGDNQPVAARRADSLDGSGGEPERLGNVGLRIGSHRQ
jgi:hypothetical protein